MLAVKSCQFDWRYARVIPFGEFDDGVADSECSIGINKELSPVVNGDGIAISANSGAAARTCCIAAAAAKVNYFACWDSKITLQNYSIVISVDVASR